PGAIWVKTFGLIGPIVESGGTPSNDSPYSEPEAACVTSRYWVPRSTLIQLRSATACGAIEAIAASARKLAFICFLSGGFLMKTTRLQRRLGVQLIVASICPPPTGCQAGRLGRKSAQFRRL